MQCPFCQQEMKSIDNGRPPPHLDMVWVCKQCPNEVRVMAGKDNETQEEWITKHTSIFVFHNDIEYCLHWDHLKNFFEIRDTSKSTGRDNYIIRLFTIPNSITPSNALDKLKVYLLFS